jgi:hypothetical protein
MKLHFEQLEQQKNSILIKPAQAEANVFKTFNKLLL